MLLALPGGFRAFAYFSTLFYSVGVLDGKEGIAFHVLQGFWYRYLVDIKLNEVKTHLKNRDIDVETAIRDVLGLIYTMRTN